MVDSHNIWMHSYVQVSTKVKFKGHIARESLVVKYYLFCFLTFTNAIAILNIFGEILWATSDPSAPARQYVTHVNYN